MVTNLLTFYIGLLVVLFIVAMIVMAISFRRAGKGKSGEAVTTITEPIPGPEQRNPQTKRPDDVVYDEERREFSRSGRGLNRENP